MSAVAVGFEVEDILYWRCSVFVVAVRVAVGTAVVVALPALRLGEEGVRREGERLNDPPGLFGHFDLRGVRRGVLREGGRAAPQGGFGRGTGLVARHRGGRLGAGLVGHLDRGEDRRVRKDIQLSLTGKATWPTQANLPRMRQTSKSCPDTQRKGVCKGLRSARARWLL